MEFRFGFLRFRISGGRICLAGECGGGFAEVNVVGENRDSHFGNKMICSSEAACLEYVSHEVCGDALLIVQRSKLTEVRTRFFLFRPSCAVRVYTEVENISDDPIRVDEVSSFVCGGFFGGCGDAEKIFLYRFLQSHHAECQPVRASLAELGVTDAFAAGQNRIGGMNIGSWSTKEELPQGILEYRGKFTMFQIESNASWYYEIGDWKEGEKKTLYLYLGGANGTFGDWTKTLAPGESYRTVPVALCVSDSLNGVIGEMSRYRRLIAGKNRADAELPIIFNEYMHLSWDSPTEENTKKYLPAVAKAGADYYVIDCGWHDEEDGKIIYPYVGRWKESKARFPHGIRATTDLIRAYGMKAGLWIEPEVVGYRCKEMIDYYGDECFLHRYGKKICVMGRYFLNFRKAKVREYLNETIRRMVEDYGAEYIKMDYNQEIGVGADAESGSLGEGLENDRRAYLEWIDSVRASYPEVLIETCSSGGMRMDYCTLSRFSVISVSDQIDYRKYPYIAGNILAAVLPEQAAVWNYPVAGSGAPGDPFEPDRAWAEENISKEQIVMNTVNALLGRMHLAGHLELLSEEKSELVREGIAYYRKLTPVKKIALPYFPLGFTRFGQKYAVSGLRNGDKIYLAVWSLNNAGAVAIPFEKKILTACVGYPESPVTDFSIEDRCLTVRFQKAYQARFFEVELVGS
ncbi:MAG: alpha-galactosidase [Clostridia bacterium]|nr:alpha-galactosidase [Clostridia bacterium]